VRGVLPRGRADVVEPRESCTHPWLRVTCGVCGAAVDALGEPSGDRAGDHTLEGLEAGLHGSQRLFIVARGHPELVEQLRTALGDREDVEIIEDRRRQPRELPTAQQARELRKRLREEREEDEET
jgi:hypothetical protein